MGVRVTNCHLVVDVGALFFYLCPVACRGPKNQRL